MVFRDLLRDTARTLSAHKLRTLLTMFGIAWGIVSITLMVAAGEGLRVGQAKVAENFGKDVMIVFAGRTSLQAGGLKAGRRVQWTATDHLEIQKQAPSCGYVMPELGQERPRAQRVQQRLPHRHRLHARLRPHPVDPDGGGSVSELGRRAAGAPRGVPRQRREEAALRQPAGHGGDASGSATSPTPWWA